MGIQIGGFGMGLMSGLTSGMSIAKQYQDSQTAKAKQALAKNVAQSLDTKSAAAAPAPATTQAVDLSGPQSTPLADDATATASAQPADDGFGNGFSFLGG